MEQGATSHPGVTTRARSGAIPPTSRGPFPQDFPGPNQRNRMRPRISGTNPLGSVHKSKAPSRCPPANNRHRSAHKGKEPARSPPGNNGQEATLHTQKEENPQARGIGNVGGQ
ncbi:hypothetical protein LIER_18886 [Lithospermum erythrorhizon]|uniref:Uncharacterized protein n=1 Tax=Lithospermum erythrorhizon TaxID=34254 RepID=A0AAV3QIJ3_LITER